MQMYHLTAMSLGTFIIGEMLVGVQGVQHVLADRVNGDLAVWAFGVGARHCAYEALRVNGYHALIVGAQQKNEVTAAVLAFYGHLMAHKGFRSAVGCEQASAVEQLDDAFAHLHFDGAGDVGVVGERENVDGAMLVVVQAVQVFIHQAHCLVVWILGTVHVDCVPRRRVGRVAG